MRHTSFARSICTFKLLGTQKRSIGTLHIHDELLMK